jgi:hypothetical protein
MTDIRFQQDQFQENPMSTSKTVIIWGQERLHAVGVESFLCGQTQWEVIRISNQNVRSLIRSVKKYRPGVVILTEDASTDNSQVPALLQTVQPDLRVIRLNLDNNIADVYGLQRYDVRNGADLISLIQIP